VPAVAPTKLANVASVMLEIPVGVSVYPRETIRPSRRWVDRWMPNLIHYNILDRGATSPPGSSRPCTPRRFETASPRCAERGRARRGSAQAIRLKVGWAACRRRASPL